MNFHITNPHAATQINTSAQTYDKNGNLTSDGIWTYAWDYRDRLTQATNGSITMKYGYDHNNNRIWMNDGTATTTYVSKYYSLTGATTTRHVFLGNEAFATIEADGLSTSTYYLHTDHLGGTNVITDENGAIVQLLDYYPFGEIRINKQSVSESDFGHKNIGASSADTTSALGSRFTMPEDGVITSIYAYTKASSGTVEVTAALYSDDSGTADDLLSSEATSTTQGTMAGWVEIDIEDFEAASGTDYWLWYNANGLHTIYWDSGDTNQYSNEWMSWPSWDDPMEGEVYFNRALSIYAKYTPISGNFDEKRKFTGHEYDEATELSYMMARYQNGGQGRFISIDPVDGDLMNPQSLNKYSYVLNNPIRMVDPLGTRATTEHETKVAMQMVDLMNSSKDPNGSEMYRKAYNTYVTTIKNIPDGGGDPKSFTIMNDAVFKWYDAQMGYDNNNWSNTTPTKSDYYSTLPAGNNTCTAFVGEVLADSVGYKNYSWGDRDDEPYYFPPNTTTWLNGGVGGFSSTDNPQSGDVFIYSYGEISGQRFGRLSGGHAGIYFGNGLYISANAAEPEYARQQGVILKYVPQNSTFNKAYYFRN